MGQYWYLQFQNERGENFIANPPFCKLVEDWSSPPMVVALLNYLRKKKVLGEIFEGGLVGECIDEKPKVPPKSIDMFDLSEEEIERLIDPSAVPLILVNETKKEFVNGYVLPSLIPQALLPSGYEGVIAGGDYDLSSNIGWERGDRKRFIFLSEKESLGGYKNRTTEALIRRFLARGERIKREIEAWENTIGRKLPKLESFISNLEVASELSGLKLHTPYTSKWEFDDKVFRLYRAMKYRDLPALFENRDYILHSERPKVMILGETQISYQLFKKEKDGVYLYTYSQPAERELKDNISSERELVERILREGKRVKKLETDLLNHPENISEYEMPILLAVLGDYAINGDKQNVFLNFVLSQGIKEDEIDLYREFAKWCGVRFPNWNEKESVQKLKGLIDFVYANINPNPAKRRGIKPG